jgi:hypothetical protein
MGWARYTRMNLVAVLLRCLYLRVYKLDYVIDGWVEELEHIRTIRHWYKVVRLVWQIIDLRLEFDCKVFFIVIRGFWSVYIDRPNVDAFGMVWSGEIPFRNFKLAKEIARRVCHLRAHVLVCSSKFSNHPVVEVTINES